MTGEQAGTILHHLRDLVELETTRALTDAQLLGRFAASREESAFAALVRRHGGLVWGVCRHLLRREQDAEDAFQATFLVLARRANAVRKTEAVGSFLHGVAYRIARKVRHSMHVRQVHERRAASQTAERPVADLAWHELQAALDEEVRRLPLTYRGAFVACCLEGMSRGEAARELGCKQGTVSSRVARARELLQERLARRGVTLPAALCAGVLWRQSAAAAIPIGLERAAVEAGLGGASATVTALAEGVAGMAAWRVGVVLLGLCVLVGVGAWGHSAAPPSAEATPKEEARKDRHGDPLPPEAVARFGTSRHRAPESHVAVTADGKEVVAVGNDLVVRRFDAATGELRSLRQLPRASTYWTWLSPRGTYLLTLGWMEKGGYQLELWDLARGELRKTLPVGGAHFSCGTAFSADERRVALADSTAGKTSTHRVLVWDHETAK